jgi:DNA-binding beta-propeller fold protein YncE
MESPAGEYLAHWQIPNASSDVFSPEHVALSPNGSTVYATDLAGDRILVLTVTPPAN